MWRISSAGGIAPLRGSDRTGLLVLTDRRKKAKACDRLSGPFFSFRLFRSKQTCQRFSSNYRRLSAADGPLSSVSPANVSREPPPVSPALNTAQLTSLMKTPPARCWSERAERRAGTRSESADVAWEPFNAASEGEDGEGGGTPSLALVKANHTHGLPEQNTEKTFITHSGTSLSFLSPPYGRNRKIMRWEKKKWKEMRRMEEERRGRRGGAPPPAGN